LSPRLNWNEVTAVFGGTFDPPHLGHREAVRGLFENPGVCRVIVVPAGTPPLKPQATSTEDRFKMAELGFAGIADVQIDGRELERSKRTGKPSFSIDTLQELRQENTKLAFVVGADQLALLQTWHRFGDLLPISHWIVLARKPNGEELAMKTLNEWEASGLIRREGSEWVTSSATRLKLVPTDAQAIASSEIRERIATETDPKRLLPALQGWLKHEVLLYLMEHRIYGMRPQ
jgi:nicotinate-nucleotide adenylyltransferase